MKMKKIVLLAAFILYSTANVHAGQAWRDCIPGSIGPGGCDSIGPGGGQSIGPGGGQSIGPGGVKSLLRDRSRGLNTDTMRPYKNPYGIIKLPDIALNKAD
jgi:hypothetical protein